MLYHSVFMGLGDHASVLWRRHAFILLALIKSILFLSCLGLTWMGGIWHTCDDHGCCYKTSSLQTFYKVCIVFLTSYCQYCSQLHRIPSLRYLGYLFILCNRGWGQFITHQSMLFQTTFSVSCPPKTNPFLLLLPVVCSREPWVGSYNNRHPRQE